MRDGAAASVEALNASGPMPDTKVMLSVADDASDPKQAAAVANRLTMDRVQSVVGHFCSLSSIPGSEVQAEADRRWGGPVPSTPRELSWHFVQGRSIT
ncbi:ABC transporter substrate-binding protein [Bradyrhizobium sp. USDA 3240]